MFLIKDVKRNACLNMWAGQEWLGKAYALMCSVVVILALALMVGFYSRVVYTLWVKRDDDNQLDNQQRVSVNENAL